MALHQMDTQTAKSKRIAKKTIAWVLVGLFVATLIPLLAASFYSRPMADDYSYGKAAARVWRDTHSIAAVISSAADLVSQSYYDWQGTYAAVFMFSFQPGIFSEKIYYLSTFLLLGSLILSTGFLLYTVLVTRMKEDRWTWMIITSLVLMLTIQFVPSGAQAFYWYNGAIFYTFFYSMMLLLVGLLLRAQLVAGWKLGLLTTGAALLSIAIGGGNYLTALGTILIVVLFCAYTFIKKSRNAWVNYLVLVLLFAGLLVSALAPGNGVRADALAQEGIPTNSIPRTILIAFYRSAMEILAWTNLQTLAVLFLLAPLLWQIAKRSAFSFRYPLIVAGMAYCLFAAQFSPPIMMNLYGDGRHVNILYYSYVLMAVGLAWYFLGWLSRKTFARFPQGIDRMIAQRSPYRHVLIGLCIVLVLAAAWDANQKGWLSKAAAMSIGNGQAQQFAAERDERLLQYLNPDVQHVVVKPLSVQPDIFFDTDLGTPDWWVNKDVAIFYEKQSVSLTE